MIARRWLTLGVALALATPGVVRAQEAGLRAEAATLDTAGAVADTWPKKFRLGINEFNLGFTTFVLGGAYLQDYSSWNQDSASREQFPSLVRQGRIRDSRFLLSGTLRSKRQAFWISGIMYDWGQRKWLLRQTTLTIAMPEIWGWLNIGRTKEGMSIERVMVGYDGWTQERFPFSDAAIPLLADGVKWLGYLPKQHVLWNLGYYMNHWSEGQTWSYYQQQVVGRLARVTMDSDTSGKLLHVAAQFHIGKPENDSLQLKSKPEDFEGPNFLDTGKFPATLGQIYGLEAYYRNGPFLAGTEYYGLWVRSPQTGNPSFNGGQLFASWIITGETRPYSTINGIFKAVSPKHPVFSGGKGALEAVIKATFTDFNTDSLNGGQFWRVTPMVNWHMTDNLRLEFEYGFGNLDRFGIRGTTEFFQARMQFQFAKIGSHNGDESGD